MKKFDFCRISALILALLMLCLPALWSCNSDVPDDTADSTPEVTTAPEPEEKTFAMTAKYKVIRPDEENDNEIAAMQLIGRAIKSACGLSLELTTDFVRRGDPVVPGEFEILVGETNREQSKELNATLKGTEGVYKIISENVIVVTGGSSEATLAAAQKFAEDIFGYKEDADKNVLSAGKETELRVGDTASVAVAFPTILLNGTDLREYSLVYDKESRYVNNLNLAIRALCGERLKACTYEEYKASGKTGPTIFFGCAPTESGKLDKVFDQYSYYMSVKGDQLAFDYLSSSITLASRLSADLASRFFSTDGKIAGKTYKIDVTDGEASYVPYEDYSNGLILQKRDDEKLADGIVYSELLYSDKDGAPVRVYAVTVEPGCGSFYCGTPNDQPPANTVVSTVMNEIKAAVANGKNVIAGTNACFFDMGGTGFSRGLSVKDGEIMASNTDRPFFAAMRDGSVRLLNAAEYQSNKAEIYNAVSGNIIIMKNGKVTDIATGTAMSYTRHPRTAVGIRADGGVVLLVVDGRQPKVSNGASYCDLVTIFRGFGCTDLLNLDGGGSSTMVRMNQNGNFQLENSPSDGSMRRVQDSLLILLPDKKN